MNENMEEKRKKEIARALFLGYKVRKIMRSKIVITLRNEYYIGETNSKTKIIELVNMLTNPIRNLHYSWYSLLAILDNSL